MNIDPNVMNEQLKEEKENRYTRSDSIENINPNIQMEMDYEEDERPEDRVYNNPIHSQEEEILPGLFESDIASWKRQFGDIWNATIRGEEFIYRCLERFEYKEIVSTPNTDPLMREEMICEYCVLYPLGYDFATMANKKAGIPAVLSEVIMEQSGFTRDIQIKKL